MRPRLKELIGDLPPLYPSCSDPVAKHLVDINSALDGTVYEWRSQGRTDGTVSELVYEFTMRHRLGNGLALKDKVPQVIWKCQSCPSEYPDGVLWYLPVNETGEARRCPCGGELDAVNGDNEHQS